MLMEPRPSTRARRRRLAGSTVNLSLTPKRQIEAEEYAGAVNRMVRALGRRGEAGDVQALIALSAVRKETALVMTRVAYKLRDEHGYSWGEIGLAYGISRQAAQQRWGRS